MRSGDALRRDVLRMAANAAYNVEKRNQKPLTDDEFLAVLTREVKTRRKSVDAYTTAGREDLAAKEQAEIAILEEYLPAALSEAEITALLDEAIAATGATNPRDMGKVMGWLSPRIRGRADGKVVSGLVASRAGPGGPRRARPEPALNPVERRPMLIHRAPVIARFTRSDATRLGVAAGILMLVMTAILGADILPEETLQYNRRHRPVQHRRPTPGCLRQRGPDRAGARRRPRGRSAAVHVHHRRGHRDRGRAGTAFEERVDRVDTAFGAELTPEERASLLEVAIPDLSDGARRRSSASTRLAGPRSGPRPPRSRCDATRRAARDRCGPDPDPVGRRMAGDLDEAERMLAAELIAPLVVPELVVRPGTLGSCRDAAAAAVSPSGSTSRPGEVVVRNGERLDAADIETIKALGIGETALICRGSPAGSCCRS